MSEPSDYAKGYRAAMARAAGDCTTKAAKKRQRALIWRMRGQTELAVRAEESAHQMECLATTFRYYAGSQS